MSGEADKPVHRNDDMGMGKLCLMKQDDGDVILYIQEKDGGWAELEFCNSGGHSPATLKALHALYAAMKEDERERR